MTENELIDELLSKMAPYPNASFELLTMLRIEYDIDRNKARSIVAKMVDEGLIRGGQGQYNIAPKGAELVKQGGYAFQVEKDNQRKENKDDIDKKQTTAIPVTKWVSVFSAIFAFITLILALWRSCKS